MDLSLIEVDYLCWCRHQYASRMT